jgi:hypothetical protein
MVNLELGRNLSGSGTADSMIANDPAIGVE